MYKEKSHFKTLQALLQYIVLCVNISKYSNDGNFSANNKLINRFLEDSELEKTFEWASNITLNKREKSTVLLLSSCV